MLGGTKEALQEQFTEFTAFENLNSNKNGNKACETIKRISTSQLKKHKVCMNGSRLKCNGYRIQTREI
jgi:hypothetical protein